MQIHLLPVDGFLAGLVGQLPCVEGNGLAPRGPHDKHGLFLAGGAAGRDPHNHRFALFHVSQLCRGHHARELAFHLLPERAGQQRLHPQFGEQGAVVGQISEVIGLLGRLLGGQSSGPREEPNHKAGQQHQQDPAARERDDPKRPLRSLPRPRRRGRPGPEVCVGKGGAPLACLRNRGPLPGRLAALAGLHPRRVLHWQRNADRKAALGAIDRLTGRLIGRHEHGTTRRTLNADSHLPLEEKRLGRPRAAKGVISCRARCDGSILFFVLQRLAGDNEGCDDWARCVTLGHFTSYPGKVLIQRPDLVPQPLGDGRDQAIGELAWLAASRHAPRQPLCRRPVRCGNLPLVNDTEARQEPREQP